LTKIEGFDHSVVNSTLGAGGELPTEQESPCLPYFIWQCGNVKVIDQSISVFYEEEFYIQDQNLVSIFVIRKIY
jgi:hypothetical protein